MSRRSLSNARSKLSSQLSAGANLLTAHFFRSLIDWCSAAGDQEGIEELLADGDGMIDPFRTATPATLWQSDRFNESPPPGGFVCFASNSLRTDDPHSRSPVMNLSCSEMTRSHSTDDGVGTSMSSGGRFLATRSASA